MTVATGELLSADKGAELIREKTGRKCSRQNLDKLCKAGKLPRCTVSTSPVRVRADLLIEEYEASIGKAQTVVDQPGVSIASRRPQRESRSDYARASSQIPDYNEERAWTEYEKKLKLQVERELLEGKLVYREDIEQAQKAVALTLQNQVLSLQQQIKNQIPHLTVEEEAVIQKLVNQVLQNVADWQFADAEVLA